MSLGNNSLDSLLLNVVSPRDAEFVSRRFCRPLRVARKQNKRLNRIWWAIIKVGVELRRLISMGTISARL